MKFLVFTVCCLFAGLTHAEVLYVDKYGFSVKNQQTISKPAQQVWNALVNDIDAWWPKDHTWWKGTLHIDERAGGCFCETSGKNSAEHMRISFVEPGKTLRMTGGLGPLQGMGMYGALDWLLTESDGKTTITLTYTVSGVSKDGYEKLAPIVAKVQGIQLSGLAKHLN